MIETLCLSYGFPTFIRLPQPLSLPHLDHLIRSLDLVPRGWRWSKHVKPIAKTE
jgi:hypothetical protein